MDADSFAAEVSAGIAGALFGRLTPVKEVSTMAGALKSPKRKTKQPPFKPARSSRIEVIEDEPTTHKQLEEIAVPMRKLHGASCTLFLSSLDNAGPWYARYDVKFPPARNLLSRSGGMAPDNPAFASRTESLFFAIGGALNWCRVHAANPGSSFSDRKCVEECEADLVRFQQETARKYRFPLPTVWAMPAGVVFPVKLGCKDDPSVGPLDAGNSQTPETREPKAADEYLQIDLGLIDPSPTNPRQHFDEEKLEQLAESIRSEGIVEPLIVRRQDQRFELVAGERRWRAAKLAGLVTVPAIVRTLSDSQALVIQVIENLQRDNLSAIEEAQGFERLLQPLDRGGAGYSQTKLAEELGCTQAHISNRVRLLELPKDWQQRVITGEIPPTHARSLVPWIKFPQVLKEVAADLKRDGVGSAEQFDETLRFALRLCSCSMTQGEYCYAIRKTIPVFTPTDEQREQLQIVAVPTVHGKQTEERAFNMKLWKQLQEKFTKEYIAQHDKRDDRKAKAKAAQPEKLTPAQQKAKENKLAEQFARRLDEWRADWYRSIIAEKLTAKSWVTQKLALYFIAGGTDVPEMKYRDRTEDLEEAVQPKGRRSPYGATKDELWSMLSEPDAKQLPEITVRLLRRWLVDAEEQQPVNYVPLAVLQGVLTDLQVDLAAEWAKNRAGKLTEAYFRLHTTDQLRKLSAELGMDTNHQDTKGSIITALMSCQPAHQPLPRELRPKG